MAQPASLSPATPPGALAFDRAGPVAVLPMAVLATLTFAAAVATPLALYTLSLAALGLPHALAELRFVAQRFAPRRPRILLATILALLGVLAGSKVLNLLGVFRASLALELSLAVALATLALPRLWRRGPGFAALGTGLVGAVAWGTVVAPLPTLLALAVLHTLTPLGFLAEGVGGPARRSTLLLALLLFVGLPLLLASGWPLDLWQRILPLALEANPLGTGSLATHFGAFFPRAWHTESWVLSAFAAVAFAQVMHQATVLAVLPRLVAQRPGRWFWPGLAVVSAVGLVAFSVDFGGTRQVYGVVAAVHAWVELPILLAALAGPLAPRLGDALKPAQANELSSPRPAAAA